jgi:excinuclease ABC subunit C
MQGGMNMNPKEKVKNLPLTPGVYLMKDSNSTIIYVGKAKHLKNRVQTYFQNSKAHSQKVKKLKTNIKDFDYILTDTEFEAFMLECKLIREMKPAFNRKMKNPQSYAYIVIKMDNPYRSIEMTNTRIEHDGNLYFGPYISKNTVEKAIIGIKECFQILCSNPSKKNSPCLNYSLGLCMGMCLGGAAIEEYKKIIGKIAGLLNGSDMSILEEVQQKMVIAAGKFDFELAAKYRDYLEAINFIITKEKVIDFTEQNNNIAIIEFLSDSTFKLFLIKRNHILFSENFKTGSTPIEHLSALIKTHFKNATHYSSKEISRDEIDEAQIIYSYLKSSNCKYFSIPDDWVINETNSSIDEALITLLS